MGIIKVELTTVKQATFVSNIPLEFSNYGNIISTKNSR
jgi:hypothetical protein